jgi:hypothetical protein
MDVFYTRFMLITLSLIYAEKGAGQKMFPYGILVEIPPPIMKQPDKLAAHHLM